MQYARFWVRVAKRLLLRPVDCFRAIRVIRSVSKIASTSKRVVTFYDRIAMHYTFDRPVAAECRRRGVRVVYVTSDPQHPLLLSEDSDLEVFFLPPGFEMFLRFINVPCVITPASNLDNACTGGRARFGHMLHSPVSLHYVYSDSAFDAYDCFFCVGPHHVSELGELRSRRGWPARIIFESGYPKIDDLVRLASTSAGERTDGRIKNILFAPSWGEKNILRSHGIEIVEALLDAGFNIVLRPHKLSFDFDVDVILQAEQKFGARSFEIDRDVGFSAMLESDLMISDWSGVAYEFAFSLGKPVVFVEAEGGRKVQSHTNRKIAATAMEDICRYQVGAVCGPSEVLECVVSVAEIEKSVWGDRIRSVRDQYFYNFGVAAERVASQILDALISDPQRNH